MNGFFLFFRQDSPLHKQKTRSRNGSWAPVLSRCNILTLGVSSINITGGEKMEQNGLNGQNSFNPRRKRGWLIPKTYMILRDLKK
ncbi:hypothetical protein CS301_02730 [Bacillus velezensis]|nr:hypothetical protein CS301_02730 [Bacillus velezensis]